MNEAYLQAQKSLSEGGLPIGSVLVDGSGTIGKGHNQRVQHGDQLPILGSCIRNEVAEGIGVMHPRQYIESM